MSLMLNRVIFIVFSCLCSVCGRAESDGKMPYPEKSRVIIRQEDMLLSGNLTVTNPGSRPWLMQVWLEDENGAREGHVYPELSRLEPNFSRRLLITPSLSQWREERENLNWLVVRLIPSTEPNGRNSLTIPVVLRLKVFLRSRSAGAEQEKPVLSCAIREGGLMLLHNSGRHYVTLTEFKNALGRGIKGMPMIVAPGAQQYAGSEMTTGAYEYAYVDDGGMVVYGRITCR
ncbi:fimbria/pilus periplasmic chaperone [Escherichia coli]|nr:fimbria/pilus periplasmic chaperone [Escherichia coli]MED9020210.1 fimbria/pilus periplasmic chaperone [Escherichia coli]